jgi:uncharacterized ferritin-like protein (DUF455 family)
MHNLFDLAERCLESAEVETKLALTHRTHALALEGALSIAPQSPPRPFAAARLPERPVLVDPRLLPKRKTGRDEGRAALLHAVAHIEFSAIQLAWDHLYRFRGLPEDYYRDWLGVAEEEAQHFEMIRERLRALDMDYGDLPAHAGLWSVAGDTADDFLARMALVPRFMEARGLDVTPGIIAKLDASGDAASVAVLKRILHDEVGHVALGTRWFGWACAQRGMAPTETYFRSLERYLKTQVRGPFNAELRKAAGFSEEELRRLEKLAAADRRETGVSPSFVA